MEKQADVGSFELGTSSSNFQLLFHVVVAPGDPGTESS